jgi:DNA-binding NarL/FixJ family response regulator
MTTSARAMPESSSGQSRDAIDTLSPAEREVAVLAAAGLTNLAIAKYRGKAVRTIANQMASILCKLGVGSRYDLAARFASLEVRR